MFRRQILRWTIAIPCALIATFLLAPTWNEPSHFARTRSIISRLADAFGPVPASAEDPPNSRVRIVTSLGTMIVELHPAAAPQTVNNFLAHVTTGKYDGVMFESVTPRFARVGSFLPGFVPVTQRFSIPVCPANESNNGLRNLRGTLTAHFSSVSYQGLAHFCINLADNPMLDYPNENDPEGLGSAVFGTVIEGMEVLDALSQAPHGDLQLEDGNVVTNVPIPTITIDSARLE